MIILDESAKYERVSGENLMYVRDDRCLSHHYGRIWVPFVRESMPIFMDRVHNPKIFIHLGATKMIFSLHVTNIMCYLRVTRVCLYDMSVIGGLGELNLEDRH